MPGGRAADLRGPHESTLRRGWRWRCRLPSVLLADTAGQRSAARKWRGPSSGGSVGATTTTERRSQHEPVEIRDPGGIFARSFHSASRSRGKVRHGFSRPDRWPARAGVLGPGLLVLGHHTACARRGPRHEHLLGDGAPFSGTAAITRVAVRSDRPQPLGLRSGTSGTRPRGQSGRSPRHGVPTGSRHRRDRARRPRPSPRPPGHQLGGDQRLPPRTHDLEQLRLLARVPFGASTSTMSMPSMRNSASAAARRRPWSLPAATSRSGRPWAAWLRRRAQVQVPSGRSGGQLDLESAGHGGYANGRPGDPRSPICRSVVREIQPFAWISHYRTEACPAAVRPRRDDPRTTRRSSAGPPFARDRGLPSGAVRAILDEDHHGAGRPVRRAVNHRLGLEPLTLDYLRLRRPLPRWNPTTQRRSGVPASPVGRSPSPAKWASSPSSTRSPWSASRPTSTPSQCRRSTGSQARPGAAAHRRQSGPGPLEGSWMIGDDPLNDCPGRPVCRDPQRGSAGAHLARWSRAADPDGRIVPGRPWIQCSDRPLIRPPPRRPEGVLQHLRQARVVPDLLTGDLFGGQAGSWPGRLLRERGGLRTDHVAAQDPAALQVHQHLGEPGAVLERPAADANRRCHGARRRTGDRPRPSGPQSRRPRPISGWRRTRRGAPRSSSRIGSQGAPRCGTTRTSRLARCGWFRVADVAERPHVGAVVASVSSVTAVHDRRATPAASTPAPPRWAAARWRSPGGCRRPRPSARRTSAIVRSSRRRGEVQPGTRRPGVRPSRPDPDPQSAQRPNSAVKRSETSGSSWQHEGLLVQHGHPRCRRPRSVTELRR